jgi:hypothetical protein
MLNREGDFREAGVGNWQSSQGTFLNLRMNNWLLRKIQDILGILELSNYVKMSKAEKALIEMRSMSGSHWCYLFHKKSGELRLYNLVQTLTMSNPGL